MKRIIFGFLILVAALAVGFSPGSAAWFSDEEVSLENALAAGVWPIVTIISPLDGEDVSGTVEIAADVIAELEVSQVDFYIDDTSIGTDAKFPYKVKWHSKSVANGTYTLTVVAIDSAGHTGKASISVDVYNEDEGEGEDEDEDEDEGEDEDEDD